ncbi:RraA family protein [Nitriliruptoraceae bacterium ZYF776]|nr:RraA family protein [Profundirhabdus halotolerans]
MPTAATTELDTALAARSTATVSDALDRLGLPGSAHGLTPLRDGQRLAGRAYTVRYVPAGAIAGTVGDYLDDVAPGQVVVLDNQGRTDATVWGDILTAVASERGVAGSVIWGVCRDVTRALTTGYPIYSAGRFMRTGKDRVEVADVQVPVAAGDARVAPGDLVLADDDGVVIVPTGHEEAVLELAVRIEEGEDRILADALELGSLGAARARHGYHTLQRRDA